MSDVPARIHLRVVTPRKSLADAEVDSVALPSVDGLIGVLPGHRPLMIALGRGEIEFRRDGRDERYKVEGGYAEIHPDRVLVYTRLAE